MGCAFGTVLSSLPWLSSGSPSFAADRAKITIEIMPSGIEPPNPAER